MGGKGGREQTRQLSGQSICKRLTALLRADKAAQLAFATTCGHMRGGSRADAVVANLVRS